MNRTDICNMALSIIQRQRIDSLEDTSEEAKVCAIYYEHSRRRLLKMFNWGFAKHMEKLALRADEIPGWQYVYGYPRECVTVQLLFDENTAERREFLRQEFQIITISGNDKVIATNVENAWAEYTYNVKNTEEFSPEFVEALTRLLASNIAFPLTGNSELQNINLQLAQQAVNIAMQESVTEQEQRTQWPRKYEQARFR
jgi:hypothetical protein